MRFYKYVEKVDDFLVSDITMETKKKVLSKAIKKVDGININI